MANNVAQNMVSVPKPLPEDLNALAAMALIIAVAGLLGGYAAYMARDKASDASTLAEIGWPRYLVLGIVAAACVPLFLSLVRSEVVEDMLTSRDHTRIESFLIFTGLCLIAAFSARAFLDSISKRVLQQVEQAQEDAREALSQSRKAEQKAEEAIEEALAEPAPAAAIDGGNFGHESFGEDDIRTAAALTEVERRALEAVAKRTYRTASGVAEESGVARHQVSELLDSLADRKLVLSTKSPRSGGQRWAISKRGLAALRAASGDR